MTQVQVYPMGLFTKKPNFACDCGTSFPSKDALMAHAAKDHAQPAQPANHACACGAGFDSKSALQKHGKTAHKM